MRNYCSVKSTMVRDGLTGQHNISIGQIDHTKITHSCILNIEQRSWVHHMQEEFEDTKQVIRCRKSKDRKYND